MRPARIVAAVALAAAVAATGSYLAVSTTTTHPSATASPVSSAPRVQPQPGTGPDPSPETTGPPGDRPAAGHCATSALQGSVQGSDGAAGTIWITVQLRNTSTKTCTVKGMPTVRLLGARAQPVTAPSKPEGPAGSPVLLRPGQMASFAFHYPNACDSAVVGSRLRVTLPLGQGSVDVPLGTPTRFGTCASVGVQALKASKPLPDPGGPTPVDRQAPIYGAVLRQYLTSGDAAIAADYRFPRIFVLDRAAAGVGGPSWQAAAGGVPISPAVRRSITQALADVGPVTFVPSPDAVIVHGCDHLRDRGILITLGPVEGVGEQVQVGVYGLSPVLLPTRWPTGSSGPAAAGGSPAWPGGARSPEAPARLYADRKSPNASPETVVQEIDDCIGASARITS